jgi:hypothetical protein
MVGFDMSIPRAPQSATPDLAHWMIKTKNAGASFQERKSRV